MRAGTRNAVKRNPQVNLVPMMDVLMTVLTFFVILSMTLNGQQVADITIPGEIELEDTTSKESTVTPFLLGINAQGQLVHDNVIIKLCFPILPYKFRVPALPLEPLSPSGPINFRTGSRNSASLR